MRSEEQQTSSLPAARTLFVTGTGTDVGKSVVAATLASGLIGSQQPCRYWKPVQTGGQDIDAKVATSLAGPLLTIVPSAFTYALPASPDQAAAAESLAPPTLAELLAKIPHQDFPGTTIIEGAGGLLVPLNDDGETWEDLLIATGWPALVVSLPGLGALNHVSLTIRRLEERDIPILGLVLSGPPHPANERTLRRLFPQLPLHVLPQIDLTPEAAVFQQTAQALAAFVARNLARLAPTLTSNCGALPSADGTWLEDDRRHVWHPYTQHKVAPDPVAITTARGVWLTTQDGQRLLDATSSWWVNTVGHGRTEIGRAIRRQQATLDHCIFAGATHRPAASLARRLVQLAGGGLDRAFFSDNGSTGIEVALKMAYQAWVNQGEHQRTHFVALRGSYHGDTFGAMAVAAASNFHGTFRPLLFSTHYIDPVTEHPSLVCPQGLAALDQRLKAAEAFLSAHHQQLAGLIVEPLVQGAAGMLVQPPAFLQGLAALCRRFHLPLIVDEVFTGFGRTGAVFACHRAGVTPDILCVAKAITGGNLPLAVTLARESVFAAFLADDKASALMHGHSYTANPIACAAAHAALDILAAEQLEQRALQLEARYRLWISEAAQHAVLVDHPRCLGGILAFELAGSGATNYYHATAAAVPAVAAKHGLFLRPLGNTLYFMPPLTITDSELEQALTALRATVVELTAPGKAH